MAKMPDETPEETGPGTGHARPTHQELREASRILRDFYQLADVADDDLHAASNMMISISLATARAGYLSGSAVPNKGAELVVDLAA